MRPLGQIFGSLGKASWPRIVVDVELGLLLLTSVLLTIMPQQLLGWAAGVATSFHAAAEVYRPAASLIGLLMIFLSLWSLRRLLTPGAGISRHSVTPSAESNA